jgi:hypothetical protein
MKTIPGPYQISRRKYGVSSAISRYKSV